MVLVMALGRPLTHLVTYCRMKTSVVVCQLSLEISSAVESPAITEETRSKEAVDLPWNVVVHNDPVNLMSYVTMVFQKVFGYPKEKAELHMLEVHQQGTLDSVERGEGARRAVCPAIARLPAARDDRAGELRWRSFATTARSRSTRSILFWRNFCARSRSAPTEVGSAAEQRLFSPPAGPDENEFCAEWKLYVEPELRRLFQNATEIVETDLRQLEANEKPFANRALRSRMNTAEAWLNALNQARLAIAAKYDFSEAELCDHYRSPIGSRRDLSLFQVNFYGFLQEFILRELDCEPRFA